MCYVYTRQQLKNTIFVVHECINILNWHHRALHCNWMFLYLIFNCFIFPAESPVHNNTRNSTLYLQPQADASTPDHSAPPPLFVSNLCEWMWLYFEYCALLLWVLWVEWTLSLVSVVGRHLGSGRMSSGFIYTGCGTYSCGNWTMRKTMRTIMSIWQQATQNTKQHDIKKSCHPFLA